MSDETNLKHSAGMRGNCCALLHRALTGCWFPLTALPKLKKNFSTNYLCSYFAFLPGDFVFPTEDSHVVVGLHSLHVEKAQISLVITRVRAS